MRNFMPKIALASGIVFAAVTWASAAPVPGNPEYDSLYATVFLACTIPGGSVAACSQAITAYGTRLANDADDVPLEIANTSFTQLRTDVFAANSPTPFAADPAVFETTQTFQAQIDELFEQLLPESGDVGPLLSPA